MNARIVTAVASLAVIGLLAVPAVAAETDSSWRPNLRIGPIVFNQPLPSDAQVIKKNDEGVFAVKTADGAIVRGVLFADPNDGKIGARAIWTQSSRLEYRGIAVGDRWRAAKRKLGSRFKVVNAGRCSWLNSSKQMSERTGPVSTQLFFSRKSGRITRIALNEITEIGCPG